MSGYVPKRVSNTRMQSSTNQTGLKLQGNPSSVGRMGLLTQRINTRVHSNWGLSGRPGDMGFRCRNGIDPRTADEETLKKYCKLCEKPGRVCLEPAPEHQGMAGGVGRINAPRFKCNGCGKLSEDSTPPVFDCQHSKAGTVNSWPIPGLSSKQTGRRSIILTWNPDNCATYYIITTKGKNVNKIYAPKTTFTYNNTSPFKNGDIIKFELKSFNKNGSFPRNETITVTWCSAIAEVENLKYTAEHLSDDNIKIMVGWENNSGNCANVISIEVSLKDHSAPYHRYEIQNVHNYINNCSFTFEQNRVTKYDLCVNTRGQNESKMKCITVGPFVPKPPIASCSNPIPTLCNDLENWFGKVNSNTIDDIGDKWGITVNCNNNIPFSECVTQYDIELTLDGIIINQMTKEGGLQSFKYLKNKNSKLKQNTKYQLQITAILHGTKCGKKKVKKIVVISGKSTNIPPPPTPPHISTLPQVYVTQYGQSSFSVLKGLFDMAYFSPTTTLEYKEQCWGIVRAWCGVFSKQYINFIVENEEIVNVHWHGGDYATTLPPTGYLNGKYPGIKPKKFSITPDAYCAVNGPVDFGLSYTSSNHLWLEDKDMIGSPIILDFLIPLSKKLYEKRDLATGYVRKVDVTLSIYPPPQYGMYSWDIGNYGNKKDEGRFNNNSGYNESMKYYTKTNKQHPKWWNSGGNKFIGNGTGPGTGRSPYFIQPSSDIILPTFQKCDFLGAGGTYKRAVDKDRGYPLDNFHQMFITLYWLNQKIMKLNWDNGPPPARQIPLFTSIHSDGEGIDLYITDTIYPTKCDSRTGELTKSPGGLGHPIGQGYLKYLCNKYLPAESLPGWRTDLTAKNFMPHNTGAFVPGSGGKMKLWDTHNKPWNLNQQRNFGLEATGTKIGDNQLGFKNSTLNMHSKKIQVEGPEIPYDGVQRYQYGWIKESPKPFTNNSEGISESFTEAYNIGENQPPIIYNEKDGKYKPYNKEVLTKVLPEKNSNYILTNLTNNLGSGCLTGKFCPGCPSDPGPYFCDDESKGSVGDHFKLNCISNSLHARIFKEYGGQTPKDFRGKSQVGSTPYSSPALTDIYMRYNARAVGAIIPLDGRGYDKAGKPMGTNDADGFYCPMSPPFIHPDDSTIDLAALGDNYTLGKSTMNNRKLLKINGISDNMHGPMGSILTLQTTLKGGTLVLDPRLPGPQWVEDVKKYKPAFTQSDNTLSTWVFGQMIGHDINKNWINYKGDLAPTKSPYRITTSLGSGTYALKNDECWRKYGADSGSCDPYGDNINSLGVLQSTGAGFNHMKHLLSALGGVMCGDKNIHQAKIGLYSIEFIPMAWLCGKN